MSQAEVGIRELKSRLSSLLRQVKAGETVVITERGRPIARIVPMAQPAEQQLRHLAEAGLIAWNGDRLQPLAPVARVPGRQAVAGLVVRCLTPRRRGLASPLRAGSTTCLQNCGPIEHAQRLPLAGADRRRMRDHHNE